MATSVCTPAAGDGPITSPARKSFEGRVPLPSFRLTPAWPASPRPILNHMEALIRVTARSRAPARPYRNPCMSQRRITPEIPPAFTCRMHHDGNGGGHPQASPASWAIARGVDTLIESWKPRPDSGSGPSRSTRSLRQLATCPRREVGRCFDLLDPTSARKLTAASTTECVSPSSAPRPAEPFDRPRDGAYGGSDPDGATCTCGLAFDYSARDAILRAAAHIPHAIRLDPATRSSTVVRDRRRRSAGARGRSPDPHRREASLSDFSCCGIRRRRTALPAAAMAGLRDLHFDTAITTFSVVERRFAGFPDGRRG